MHQCNTGAPMPYQCVNSIPVGEPEDTTKARSYAAGSGALFFVNVFGDRIRSSLIAGRSPLNGHTAFPKPRARTLNQRVSR